jgi:hypothetical protein
MLSCSFLSPVLAKTGLSSTGLEQSRYGVNNFVVNFPRNCPFSRLEQEGDSSDMRQFLRANHFARSQAVYDVLNPAHVPL